MERHLKRCSKNQCTYQKPTNQTYFQSLPTRELYLQYAFQALDTNFLTNSEAAISIWMLKILFFFFNFHFDVINVQENICKGSFFALLTEVITLHLAFDQ